MNGRRLHTHPDAVRPPDSAAAALGLVRTGAAAPAPAMSFALLAEACPPGCFAG